MVILTKQLQKNTSMEKDFIATMTWQEFEARFTQFFNRIQEKAKENTPHQLPERVFLSKKEAAALLSVCPHTLDNNARAGNLTRHYIGSRVVYHIDEITALAKGRSDASIKKMNKGKQYEKTN
jgi:hypothetical protein